VTDTEKLPIIFVRYAPGSAGNFLISLLQTSNKISCWNTDVELSKGTDEFEQQFMTWFANCFQADLDNHLKHEPHHPYALDFFSAKHARGDDISVENFIDHLIERKDQLFLENIRNNKLTVMRLCKPIVPLFGQGSAVINIIVDAPAKKWFYKTRLIKLFGNDGQAWISKENHPDFLKAKFKKLLFHNQYRFQVSQFAFLKNFVVNEPAIRPFFHSSWLLQDPSNQTCKQLCINLSVIFEEKLFVETMISLFAILDLGEPNLDLMKWAHRHYTRNDIDPLR
jgi:hypothetical protein